jgi:hypothetical protein
MTACLLPYKNEMKKKPDRDYAFKNSVSFETGYKLSGYSASIQNGRPDQYYRLRKLMTRWRSFISALFCLTKIIIVIIIKIYGSSGEGEKAQRQTGRDTGSPEGNRVASWSAVDL